MGIYLKHTVEDFLICLAASVALAFTACSAFYATQPYQTFSGVLLMAFICTLVLSLLFASTATRALKFVCPCILACALVLALAVSFIFSPGESVLDDTQGNTVFFLLCTAVPAIVVYALSRRCAATIVLGIFGVLFCAAIEYLYFYGHSVACAVFLIAVIVLFIYRSYQKSLIDSESEHLAFASVTAAGLAIALFATVLSACVFAAAIAPLNPPNLVVKLITEHYRADEIEVLGIGSLTDILNDALTSSQKGSSTVDSSNDEDTAELSQNDEQTDSGENERDTQGAASSDEGENASGEGEDTGSVGIDWPSWFWPAAGGCAFAAVLAAIVVKRLLRQRRFKRMLACGPDGSVYRFYLFFLDRFARCRMPLPTSCTLKEYAVAFQDVFNRFEQSCGRPDFADLTDIYCRNVYGGKAASAADVDRFVAYYDAFYARTRAYVGRVRYALRYFFL